MNIKIQCPCGVRYSFEVEPVQGRMPFAVNCPGCKADGIEAANALIAQSLPAMPAVAKVGVNVVAISDPAPPPVAASAPPDSAEIRRAMEQMKRQKQRAEEINYRLGVTIVTAVVVALALAAGGWAWYYAFGSKPRMIYSTVFGGKLTEPAVQFIGPDLILMADAEHARLRDLRTGQDVWSANLPRANDPDAEEGQKPALFSGGPSVWICLRGRIIELDRTTGAFKKTTLIAGELETLTATDNGLLIVSATDPTTKHAMRVDFASDSIVSQIITVPRSEKHQMPDELPPNVEPTAAVLVSQALEEQKFNHPIDAMSSEFFSAGPNLVELRVQLIEPKVTWVQSIKPKGPSLLNGETTASTSIVGLQEETFNDLKRSRTGGVKAIDESHYLVKLRRWTGQHPVEWSGDVNGLPAFFPLKTVDLLAAGKSLTVFDKQNQKLFQANLTYPIADRFLAGHGAVETIPGVEGPGGLYFFDKGVLTAFDLPGGQVRWRLTTIGVSHVQFDDKGLIYVNSTSASPEDIQYSDQITFGQIHPVLMKVDPKNGKIIWQQDNDGQDSAVSGKFVYASSVSMGGIGLASALGEALNAPRQEGVVHFHLSRLNPDTGDPLWDFSVQGEPDDLDFQGNKFVTRYGNDIKVWTYLAF